MKRLVITTIVICLLTISTSGLHAAAGPLAGDPAPLLTGAIWLKGKPVTRWERGKIYILDIWAPWCGPCLGGMQHLTDLQQRYAARGLVVVGMTSPDEYGTTLDSAKKAVAAKGPAIGYTIAWDERHSLYDVWMAREKTSGWPWSFIIGRDGRIAFIGHPEKLDASLGQILDGTYDMAGATRRYRGRAAALGLATLRSDAMRRKDWRAADETFSRILASDREVAAAYTPSEYKLLALHFQETRRAAAFGRTVLRTLFPDDPDVLQRLAELIVDPATGLKARDLDLARLCADRADTLTKHHNAGMAGTLARVDQVSGMLHAAVEAQSRAVMFSSPQDRAEAQKILERYRTEERASRRK
jgi:thiol-disulfide isomerase/thioredoxin